MKYATKTMKINNKKEQRHMMIETMAFGFLKMSSDCYISSISEQCVTCRS